MSHQLAERLTRIVSYSGLTGIQLVLAHHAHDGGLGPLRIADVLGDAFPCEHLQAAPTSADSTTVEMALSIMTPNNAASLRLASGL